MDGVSPPHVATKLLACGATSKRHGCTGDIGTQPDHSSSIFSSHSSLLKQCEPSSKFVTGPAETLMVWSGWYSFCIFALPKWRLHTGSCVPERKREKKRKKKKRLLFGKQNVKAQCSKPQIDFCGSACWKHKNNTNFPKRIRSQKPPRESREQVSAMEPTEKMN